MLARILLAVLLVASAIQAEAKTLREAVRDGYEVRTASGFWVVLQKGKSIVFCNTQNGAADIPCTVVE